MSLQSNNEGRFAGDAGREMLNGKRETLKTNPTPANRASVPLTCVSRLPLSASRKKMPTIHSFASIEPAHAKVLILGSMPGKASLRAQQYYAHPRNAFWPIMARLLGFSAQLPYPQKVAALQAAGIGLWDALAACTRESSLDSDIIESSIVPNDFPAWFERHSQTQAIFCNGAKAFDSYRKYVLPRLPASFAALPLHRLPSTSPAHASLALDAKFEHWSLLNNYLFG